MALWPVYLIVAIASGGCLFLWFRDVRRVMREEKSRVEIALNQLAEWDNRLTVTLDDPETTAIFERCKSIYEQAIDHHNRAMRKPFHYLPAYLMGFRIMSHSVIVLDAPFDNGDIPIVLPLREDNNP